MKKKYLLLTFFASTLLLASCNPSNGSVEKGDYTLTLKAQGGTFSDGSNTKTYTSAGKITSASALETPSRSATSSYTYTFNGWYDGSNDSASAISFPYTLNQNTTFYAHWNSTAVKTYSVTLNANGGKFADGTSTYKISNTSKVRKNDIAALEPTHEKDYPFLGWWYTTTKKNDPVEFPLEVTSDITIFAMWGEGDGCTVTLDPDGGTFTDGTSSKTFYNEYVITYSALDTPTKKYDDNKYYTFVGWSADSSSIKSGSEILTTETLELKALWRAPSSTDFTIYASEGGTYTKEGNIHKLTSAGTYTVYGTLENGEIYVDAGDNDNVNIVLNGASITSTSSAYTPIYVNNASDVNLKAQEGTENYIYDNRTSNNGDDVNAVYANSDLDLVGRGSLHIESKSGNAITCEKDLKIKNLTLYAKGQMNCLKADNSININSGTLTLVATSNDALKTTKNGTTSKGNQQGDITITGGTINIDAYGDGIESAHDILIDSGTDDDGNTTTPNIQNIRTNKYAVTGGTATETEHLYIRSKTQLSKVGAGNVIVQFSNSGGTPVVLTTDEEKEETEEKGGAFGPTTATTYYVFKVEMPKTSYSNVRVYVGTDTTTYTYSTASKSFNSSYNMITLSSLSKSSTSISWGNHDDTASCKGLKAENLIKINNGDINIKAYGNGIHANGDTTIESTSSKGVGTVEIVNGTISIYSDNKGIRGDNYLNVRGGTVNVTNAYEGYESSQINIIGGINHVYATDDGFNAGCKDSTVTTKQINVSGGFVDIQVSGSDVDGIDSNGTFTQTGGIVVSRASNSNTMSTALDTDGQSTISNSGVFIAIGAVPEVREEKQGKTLMTCSTYKENIDKSFYSSKTYTVNSTYTFKTTMDYSKYHYYLGSSASAPTVS